MDILEYIEKLPGFTRKEIIHKFKFNPFSKSKKEIELELKKLLKEGKIVVDRKNKISVRKIDFYVEHGL